MSRDGQKTGGKDFEVGHGVKSPGRPKVHPQLKGVKPLTKENFARAVSILGEQSVTKLREYAAMEAFGPSWRAMVAKIMVEIYENTDVVKFQFLLDRTIGKPKEHVQIEATHQLPTREEALKALTEDYAVLPPKDVVVEDL